MEGIIVKEVVCLLVLPIYVLTKPFANENAAARFLLLSLNISTKLAEEQKCLKLVSR